MKSHTPSSILRSILPALAICAAASLLAPAAAAGSDHGRHRDHRHEARHGHPHATVAPVVRPRVAVGPFLAPQSIGVAVRGSYRPYYRGSVYYAPHHHRHPVYDFPVLVGGVRVVQPHVYCGGRLLRAPRLSFHVRF